MPTAKAAKKTPMSASHKAALAVGREEGRAIRAYLDALQESSPKSGRRRTAESIDRRLAVISGEIDEAEPLRKVTLVQQRLDLIAERERLESVVDLSGLEEGFVSVAASYSQRKGISKAAWREVGVPVAVLKAAGL